MNAMSLQPTHPRLPVKNLRSDSRAVGEAKSIDRPSTHGLSAIVASDESDAAPGITCPQRPGLRTKYHQ